MPGVSKVIENNALGLRGINDSLKSLYSHQHHGIHIGYTLKWQSADESVGCTHFYHYGLRQLKTNCLFAGAMMNAAKHAATTSRILNSMNGTKSTLDARDRTRED